MPTTLTIDLDSLSSESAQRISAMILAYAGLEAPETEIHYEGDEAPEVMINFNQTPAPLPEPSAAEAFGSGPQLVLPNPSLPQDANANAISSNSPTAAPTVNVSTATALANVQLDSHGLPHDPRIHSKEKTFTKEGSWRIRRGLPDGYAEKVTEENRKLMAIPSLAQSAAPLPPPPPIVASVPMPPPPPSDPMAFVNLATKVTSAISSKQLTPDQVQKVAESVGLATFMQLAVRQDLVSAVTPLIDALLAGNASAQ